MKLFAGITKVDEAKRLVYGRAVQEVADRADEIFDYATSKPHFQEWSKAFSDDTGGKSLGNIRAMHGKTAAGKVTQIDFNDGDRAIDIAAKIVDDNEWKKVLEGVYTGFSIGGSYVGDRITEKAEGGKEIRRYTAKPSEISIVDSPCIPTAKFFEVVKADGATEQIAFKPPVLEVKGSDDDVAKFAEALNSAEMTLADAIALVNKAADEKKNPPAPVAKAEPPAVDPLDEAIAEAVKLGDLRKNVTAAVGFLPLMKMATDHAVPEEEVAKATTVEELRELILGKAKMSAANMDRLQAAHDHIAAMGASCGDSDADGKATPTGDLMKRFEEHELSLQKALARVAELEKQPMPHPVRLIAVKKEDTTGKPEDNATDALASKPYEWLVKSVGGAIDWKASEEKLAKETLGAAA